MWIMRLFYIKFSSNSKNSGSSQPNRAVTTKSSNFRDVQAIIEDGISQFDYFRWNFGCMLQRWKLNQQPACISMYLELNCTQVSRGKCFLFSIGSSFNKPLLMVDGKCFIKSGFQLSCHFFSVLLYQSTTFYFQYKLGNIKFVVERAFESGQILMQLQLARTNAG